MGPDLLIEKDHPPGGGGTGSAARGSGVAASSFSRAGRPSPVGQSSQPVDSSAAADAGQSALGVRPRHRLVRVCALSQRACGHFIF